MNDIERKIYNHIMKEYMRKRKALMPKTKKVRDYSQIKRDSTGKFIKVGN